MDIIKIVKAVDGCEAGELLANPGNWIWGLPRDSWSVATVEDIAEYFRKSTAYEEDMEPFARALCEAAGVDCDAMWAETEDPWPPIEAAAEKLGVEIY